MYMFTPNLSAMVNVTTFYMYVQNTSDDRDCENKLVLLPVPVLLDDAVLSGAEDL